MCYCFKDRGSEVLFSIKGASFVLEKEAAFCCVWRTGCVLPCLCSEGVLLCFKTREMFYCVKERGRDLQCNRINV